MMYVIASLVLSAAAAVLILVLPAPEGARWDWRARWPWAAPPLTLALVLVTLFVMAIWVVPSLGYGWDEDKPQDVDVMMGLVFGTVAFLPLIAGSVLGSLAWRDRRSLWTLTPVVADTCLAALAVAFVVLLITDTSLWAWFPAVVLLLGIDALLARPWQPAPPPVAGPPTSAGAPSRHAHPMTR